MKEVLFVEYDFVLHEALFVEYDKLFLNMFHYFLNNDNDVQHNDSDIFTIVYSHLIQRCTSSLASHTIYNILTSH